MEEENKVEEKKKSKAGIIIVIIIAAVLIIGLICFILAVVSGVLLFNSAKKQIQELPKIVLVGTKETTITDETKKCFDTYSYKELIINGKVVDLGVNTKEDLDQCYVSSVESYKKADDFIVVNVEKVTNSDGNYATSTLFVLDNTGKILKSINELDEKPIYNLTYSLINNKITINAYSEVINSLVPPLCSKGENNAVAGTYEITYLGNNNVSEIIKTKSKTYGEVLKEEGMSFKELCSVSAEQNKTCSYKKLTEPSKISDLEKNEIIKFLESRGKSIDSNTLKVSKAISEYAYEVSYEFKQKIGSYQIVELIYNQNGKWYSHTGEGSAYTIDQANGLKTKICSECSC